MEKKKKSKAKATGIAASLWLLAALIILILFLVNQDKIFSNLKTTDFFSRVFGKTPAFVENASRIEETPQEKNDVGPLGSVELDITGGEERSVPDEAGLLPSAQDEVPPPQDKTEPAVPAQDKAPGAVKEKSPAQEESAKPKPAEPAVRTMNLKLYFMAINSDGSVSRREVTRRMKKSDSPLMDAVNALIAGPTTQEQEAGCRSLVSVGTRLIGASVKDGTATLNFSGEFEFNQYGIEGTRGQLQQIVYTATAFPTVDSVQFLVDGEKKEYLGSEGVWIGTPLNRNSF